MNYAANAIHLQTPGRKTGHALALQSLVYRGRIEGPIARYTLQQHFTNRSRRALEVIYTFPLQSNMLITGVRWMINGKIMQAEVLSRKEAEKQYENAVLSGNTASYLEQHRSNVFTMNIGNLKAGETMVIQIQLAQLLRLHDHTLRILLPTVVGPRYIPGTPTGHSTGFGWSPPTDAVPDADWITPPVSEDGVPYRVSFVIEIDDRIPIKTIDSPSHRFRMRKTESATVIESVKEQRADRDIVINLQVDQLPYRRVWKADTDQHTLLLCWPPATGKRSRQKRPKDYLFLIDKSGSMGTIKMKVVRQAVLLSLSTLLPEDRFNLIAFDNQSVVWKAAWAPNDGIHFAIAEDWIERLQADGGTELWSALRRAFSLIHQSDREVVLVIFTDGQVGDERRIAELFDASPPTLKVLLFGIDTTINQDLFEQIARRVPAEVEFIFPGEPLEEKISAQFRRGPCPAVQTVKPGSKGLRVSHVFPQQPKLLHARDAHPYVIACKGTPPQELELQVLYTDNTQKQFTTTVEPLSDELSTILARFFAHFLIQQYEVELTAASRENNPHRKKYLQRKITQLALDHQLQTRWTSWVARMERRRRSAEMPIVQIVPVELPKTWKRVSLLFLSKSYSRSAHFPMPQEEETEEETNSWTSYARLRTLAPSRESSDLIQRLLQEQKQDGSIIICFDENLQMHPVYSTLYALLAIVNHAQHSRKRVRRYSDQLKRACDYLLQHRHRLNKRQQLLVSYILEILKRKNVILGDETDWESNLPDGRHFKEFCKELKKLELKDFSRLNWELFIESIHFTFKASMSHI